MTAATRSVFTSTAPTNGLYVCPMIWRELDNFSSGSVCMVLASNHYDEADYYRDYASFINGAGSRNERSLS